MKKKFSSNPDTVYARRYYSTGVRPIKRENTVSQQLRRNSRRGGCWPACTLRARSHPSERLWWIVPVGVAHIESIADKNVKTIKKKKMKIKRRDGYSEIRNDKKIKARPVKIT